MERIDDIGAISPPAEDAIHIWGVHLPDVADRMEAFRLLLNKQELEKADRFMRTADREASIAARGALRVLLSGYTDLPAAELEFNYSENGKPHLADSDLSFNVSHSADWVVLAFGLHREVGVDVEQIRTEVDVESIAARYFSAAERRLIETAEMPHSTFFELWARKEAYIKARGSGIFRELDQISVVSEGNELPDESMIGTWHVHRLEAGSRYAAAVVTDRPVVQIPCYDFGGLSWAC